MVSAIEGIKRDAVLEQHVADGTLFGRAGLEGGELGCPDADFSLAVSVKVIDHVIGLGVVFVGEIDVLAEIEAPEEGAVKLVGFDEQSSGIATGSAAEHHQFVFAVAVHIAGHGVLGGNVGVVEVLQRNGGDVLDGCRIGRKGKG